MKFSKINWLITINNIPNILKLTVTFGTVVGFQYQLFSETFYFVVLLEKFFEKVR
jgi:hypothetical protein